MEITSKVFSLGNSSAVRLPRLLMEAMALKPGDPITMEVIDHQELRIKKNVERTAYPSIKELFSGYSGTYVPVEMEADDGVGREVL